MLMRAIPVRGGGEGGKGGGDEDEDDQEERRRALQEEIARVWKQLLSSLLSSLLACAALPSLCSRVSLLFISRVFVSPEKDRRKGERKKKTTSDKSLCRKQKSQGHR